MDRATTSCRSSGQCRTRRRGGDGDVATSRWRNRLARDDVGLAVTPRWDAPIGGQPARMTPPIQIGAWWRAEVGPDREAQGGDAAQLDGWRPGTTAHQDDCQARLCESRPRIRCPISLRQAGETPRLRSAWRYNGRSPIERVLVEDLDGEDDHQPEAATTPMSRADLLGARSGPTGSQSEVGWWRPGVVLRRAKMLPRRGT